MKVYLQAEKIFIANQAVDFRKSVDGLCAEVTKMQENPGEGIFIFYNRDHNRLKIIGRHINGFMMIYKRLDRGKFFIVGSADKISITRQQLEWLLLGVNWQFLSKNNIKFQTFL